MNEEQKAAYINAMVACALIEMNAMLAANQQGRVPQYTEGEFKNIINEYGIHHNAVLSYLRS